MSIFERPYFYFVLLDYFDFFSRFGAILWAFLRQIRWIRGSFIQIVPFIGLRQFLMRKEAAVIEGWLILSSYGIEIQLNHQSPFIFYLFNCYIGDILPFLLLWTEAFLDPDH